MAICEINEGGNGVREIKFRAWYASANRMRYELYFNGEINGIFNKKTYPKSEAIYMQYTGLKDKNGREIYEGDIVEITGHPFDRNEKEPCWNGKYIARYYRETMELVFSKYTDENEGGWIAYRMRHYAEVIGNIYENPELLEGAAR